MMWQRGNQVTSPREPRVEPLGVRGEGKKAGKFARCPTYQPLLILSHNPPSSPVRYLQLLSFYW